MVTIEQDTIAAPHRRALVQTPPREAFERIARLAAHAFGTPAAAISLTGDTCQWLVARTGLLPPMLPREGTPCCAALDGRRPVAVPDLQRHPAYRTGLLAQTGQRFYAAAPLLPRLGPALGVLCVMDVVPREATGFELSCLEDLAALAMTEILLRHADGRIEPLSGMPNRHQFLEELEELARVEPGSPRLLALIDLARPDEVSHMLHAVGSGALDDMVLAHAQALRASLEPGSRLFHVAATQFALLAPRDAEVDAFAARLGEDLPQVRTGAGAGAAFPTTCTAGLALVTPGEASAADLLRRAFTALDGARRRRAPVGLFSADEEAASRRAFTLMNDFAAALVDGKSLRQVFQPRLDLATGRCVGVEALLRWTHPTLGEVPPGEFVRLIDKTVMAGSMLRWVLREGLRQLADWRTAGMRIQLSINVSPANLEEPDFAAYVLSAVQQAGVPPHSVELEITENAILDGDSPGVDQLEALARAGVGIAIDDFGTGYSSLSYLQLLPARIIKIDRSFIRDLGPDGADKGRRRTLVTALIGLSHDLGYRVVAEGIETQAAVEVLRGLKCDEVQGYHFARPMPPAAFAAWHAQRPWMPDRAPVLAARVA